MPQLKRCHVDKRKELSVFDVAAYILEKQPKKRPITAWKLQKLIYYCQVWALVWDEEPLFKEKILAWANGPVVKELYQLYKGQFYVEESLQGCPDYLCETQKDTVNHVLKAYGDKTAQWLSDLTHSEDPWIQARKGLKPGERGENEIKLPAMHEYYSSIDSSHRISS
jgi:uncharacterized phage-associated protein